MNTRIDYLYRDADNNKQWNSAVIEGVIDDDMQERILACRNEGLYFIPDQVGLDEERPGEYDDAVDHVWFELYDDAFSPTSEASCGITAEQLTAAFEDASGNWDIMAAMERFW